MDTYYSHFIELKHNNQNKLYEAYEAARTGSLFHYFADKPFDCKDFQRPHDIYVDFQRDKSVIAFDTKHTDHFNAYNSAHGSHGFEFDVWTFASTHDAYTYWTQDDAVKRFHFKAHHEDEWDGFERPYEAEQRLELFKAERKRRGPAVRSFEDLVAFGSDKVEPLQNLYTHFAN